MDRKANDLKANPLTLNKYSADIQYGSDVLYPDISMCSQANIYSVLGSLIRTENSDTDMNYCLHIAIDGAVLVLYIHSS